jgi:hypothetical protein
MTRHVLRAIDFGASVVFMAFCAKALLTHFYKDLRLQQQQQRLAVIKDAPSLIPAIAVRQLSPVPVRSAPLRQRPPSSANDVLYRRPDVRMTEDCETRSG